MLPCLVDGDPFAGRRIDVVVDIEGQQCARLVFLGLAWHLDDDAALAVSSSSPWIVGDADEVEHGERGLPVAPCACRGRAFADRGWRDW